MAKTPEVKVYKNDTITLSLPASLRRKAKNGVSLEEAQNNIKKAVFDALDVECDTLPVNGALEEIQIGENCASAWRMFSFQTLQEYHITEDALFEAGEGKLLRLRPSFPTKDTLAEMMWLGNATT